MQKGWGDLCLEISVPLEYFLLIWRRRHCRWRTANFDLCSALMAIVQWGFFSVPHLLWHEASFYDGHLRGPVTLTPNAERWQWNCHYLYVRLRSVAVGIRTPTRPLAGRTLLPTAPTPRPCCYWKKALLTLTLNGSAYSVSLLRTLQTAKNTIDKSEYHRPSPFHGRGQRVITCTMTIPHTTLFFDWYNLMYHIWFSNYETFEIYFNAPINKNKMFL